MLVRREADAAAALKAMEAMDRAQLLELSVDLYRRLCSVRVSLPGASSAVASTSVVSERE